jgi:hypothetical protein
MESRNYWAACSNHITIDYSCDVTIAMDSAKGINNPKGYTSVLSLDSAKVVDKYI